MGGSNEHRQHARIKKLLFSEMSVFEESGLAEMPSLGRTLNLSEGGILMEIPKGIPFQLKVKVNLGIGDDVIALDGEIVNLRKKDDGDFEVGIAFSNPTQEQRDLIKACAT